MTESHARFHCPYIPSPCQPVLGEGPGVRAFRDEMTPCPPVDRRQVAGRHRAGPYQVGANWITGIDPRWMPALRAGGDVHGEAGAVGPGQGLARNGQLDVELLAIGAFAVAFTGVEDLAGDIQ